MPDPKSTENASVTPKRIAIIGTAEQWVHAPFDDLSWDIWTIYGLANSGRRITRLYELHDKSIILPMVEKQYPDGKYWAIANALGASYITKDAYEQTPQATRFQFKPLIDKYGPYFASSASWLLADAINEIEKNNFVGEIGIWGVNMCSDGEYAHQKPSLSYLLGFAKAKGIKITIPSSSELLALTHQYGIEQEPRFMQALALRKQATINEKNSHTQNKMNFDKWEWGCQKNLELISWLEQNYLGISSPIEEPGAK